MSRNSDNNVSRNGDISESSSMLANDAEKQDPDDYIIVSEETNLNDQFESDSSNSNITVSYGIDAQTKATLLINSWIKLVEM